MSHRTCAECGARNEADAEACALCGFPLDRTTPAADAPAAPAAPAKPPATRPAASAPETAPLAGSAAGTAPPAAPEPEAAPEAGPAAGEVPGVFCNNCGWENPAGARFCSQCGARLQDVAPAAPARSAGTKAASVPRASAPKAVPVAMPPTERPPVAATPPPGAARRMGVVVGAAVLLVVALFLITVVSRQRPAPEPAPAAPAAAGTAVGTLPQATALAPEQADQAAALASEIEGLEGEAKVAKQRELVDLLVGFGRPDHAAPVQRAVAEAEDTEEAWRRTGDLYFDWMEAMPETDRIPLSAQSVDAYRKALEKAPGNMDVRADMAWALQYDPQNAMAAIQENQTVLQADPDHVQANYNRAVFLMRINRLDQAAEQFERVKQIVGPESPIYEQAERLIQAIREAHVGQPAG